MANLDVNIINPFIESTDNLFSVMMNMSVTRGIPFIREDTKNSFYYISGIIGLAGDASGCVVVSFPLNVALRVVSKFVGEDAKEMNEEVKDAIGEVVNIIAGGAKKGLAEKGYVFKLSIPTVVTGNDHEISRSSDIPCIVIPFDTTVGRFVVEVSLKKN
ncbi:MAG: chemotaxis protein CheX [bacterium]